MRPLVFLALMFFPLIIAAADLNWHEMFVGGVGDRQTTNIGKVSVSLQTREVPNAAFKEDHLAMLVHHPGKPEMEEWVESSYGQIAVAIHGDLLFLRYGIGRGTYARENHIKILKLNYDLHELADVHTSFYVNRPKKDDPDLVEYQTTVQTGRNFTAVTFLAKERIAGLPKKKVLRFER